ncbi:MAG: Crp/Fnr family transcriptional regulator [Pirellulales bacterium]
MSTTNVLQALRTSTFFSGFSDDHLKRLAELGRVEEFPVHKTVFEEYEPAKDVYVILSGEISLAICEPEEKCKQIAVVHAGDLMGWSPLVGRARLYDTAHTLTPVRALEFDGEELMKFCAANPAFGFQFMHRVACTLAERLGGTRLQLLEMSGVHLPEFPTESD